MVCLMCDNADNNKSSENNQCLESALTAIRDHVKFYIQTIEKKDGAIQFLQTRNEKLIRAVKLLQREKNSNTQSTSGTEKRRRITASELGISQSLRIDDASSDTSFNDEALPPAELNVALDDSKLLETSQTPNETIGATEKVRSPRALRRTRSEWGARFKRELLKDENDNPLQRASTVLIGERNKCDWLMKKSHPRITLPKSPQSNKFLQGDAKIESKKKSGLSIQKPKFRQTRLQLASRGNRRGLDSTFCDVIEASPSPLDALKQSKSSRTWMARTGHNNKSKQTGKNDDGDDVFDFPPRTFKKPAASKETLNETAKKFAHTGDSNNEEQKLMKNLNDKCDFNVSPIGADKPIQKLVEKSLDEISFQIRSDSDNELEKMDCDKIVRVASPTLLKDKQTESESLIVVPPATPEIVFLDDSCDADDITQIESMDLLKELMKSDGCSGFDNLKRLENEKIQKLQKQASSLQCGKPATKGCYTGASTSKTANKLCANIKQEKVSQDVDSEKKNIIDEKEEHAQDKSEEFFVRPIPLKEEPLEKNDASQPLTILERFKVDCSDCQKYLRFLGNNLSDKEIEAHLRNCTKHKERDVMRHETPEGFWNPLMLSFDEDDPRREVLLDTRFVGKKRNT